MQFMGKPGKFNRKWRRSWISLFTTKATGLLRLMEIIHHSACWLMEMNLQGKIRMQYLGKLVNILEIKR